MYLVEVDDGLPEVVLLLVEVSHTNLTEVTRVVLSQSQPFHPLSVVSRRRVVEPCPCWYGGGADHRQDHDHRGACGAFRHGPYRRKRGRDYEAERVSPSQVPSYIDILGASSRRRRRVRSMANLSALVDVGERDQNVLLAGLRQTGRHGDGCGVVAFPVFTGRS